MRMMTQSRSAMPLVRVTLATQTAVQPTAQLNPSMKVLHVGVRGFGTPPSQETLRKYSVVPVVARHLTADDQLSGYRIPAGSTIIAHLQAVHNDGWKQPARCPLVTVDMTVTLLPVLDTKSAL